MLAATPAFSQESVESITVTAQKLAAARNGIQTQTGASTYTITAQDIQAQPGGAMLAVALSAEDVEPYLSQTELSLAGVNGPTMSVVSGTLSAVAELEHLTRVDGRWWPQQHRK